MANVLIIGCGAIGTELGNQLAGKGHRVTGLKRKPPTDENKFNFIAADITSTQTLEALDKDFDCVFFIVSPNERSEKNYHDLYQIGLNNILTHFDGHQPAWFFVSSTSVYGQHQGEWVDEESTAQPDTVCSQLIREAELRLINLNAGHTIVRFSGIYGPGREYLLRMAKQSPLIQKAPPYYTNRIHQQDCVGVLIYLLEQRLAGVALESCYLASDDDPAPMWDVITWLTQQMQCPAPLEKNGASEHSMNKRCNNSRLKALGYRFTYPSYKEGYQALIDKNQAFKFDIGN
jgi:nucleoside-diphosphate-sugar epimerase